MEHFVELPEYAATDDVQTHQQTCFCCLSKNLKFINLSTCKHVGFFEEVFKIKMELMECLICHYCHCLLRKMELFRQQVEESILVLNGQVNNSKPMNKIHNLKHSTPNSLEPISGLETEKTKEELSSEVIVEDGMSDFEADDVPLSELKNKKAKSAQTKKTPTLQNKYKNKIRITILSREEMMEERQRDASKESYLKLPYKCESCITGFDHELNLKEHMEKRHTVKEGGLVCDICNSVLNTEASYKEHTKRHVRRYECEECGRRYNSMYSAVKHYNEHHGEILLQFTCSDCGFTTGSQRGYRYHRDKHKEKPQCTTCGNTFVNSAGLKIHMLTVHKKSNRVYSCQSCERVYRAKSGLLAHMAAVHRPDAFCTPCGRHFRTPHNLRQHLRTHSKHITECDKRFVCKECGAKFLTKPSMQEHLDWVHLKIIKHECKSCSKVFKNSIALKRHQSFVHEKKRPPKNKICDHCGRSFTTLSILRSHIRTHTGEKPLHCNHCPAAFAHPAALYTHNKLLHNASLRPANSALF